jgi:pimeloyl-ACP methyl ester carboxylesterase
MGESEWTDATDFSFPGQGHTLKQLVDRLGLERYSVLAQDTGGTFARFLALEDGARIAALVLINTEIPNHRPPWIPLYQFSMRVPGALAVFRMLLRSDRFLRSSMGFGGCFNDLRLIEGDFREHVVEPLLRSPHRLDGMRRYLLGATWKPVDALARDHARLTMPVRLIWGADDPTFPVALARAMVAQFADAQLTEIAGGRLLVHEEKPAVVLPRVPVRTCHSPVLGRSANSQLETHPLADFRKGQRSTANVPSTSSRCSLGRESRCWRTIASTRPGCRALGCVDRTRMCATWGSAISWPIRLTSMH